MSTRQRFRRHQHRQHQLAWALSGTVVVGVAEGFWVLPPSRAMWIPAGVAHSVRAYRPSIMQGIFFSPGRCPIDWTVPTVVAVAPLLRELIGYLATPIRPASRTHAEAIVFDLLQPVTVNTLSLPLPTDAHARRVADAILAAPIDTRTLGQWGRLVGASERTLARLFVQETGLTFGRWRTEARLCAALPMLAEGDTVSAVARRVGYASPAAFVAAFRATIGTTPGRYFSDEEEGSPVRRASPW
jgi:AraC-like DNA-binding protein